MNNKPADNYPCWCMSCIDMVNPQMMTGYCIWGAYCDRCGNLTNLAIVKRPVQGEK